MDQSRRQLLQGAAGLLAGFAAAKAVGAVTPPPEAAASLPAVLPPVEPAAEAAVKEAVSSNEASIKAISDLMAENVANRNGDIFSPAPGKLRRHESAAEFYRTHLGVPYARDVPHYLPEEYLQPLSNLELSVRLVARPEGHIECELAPGLFITPHLVLVEPKGLATIVVRRIKRGDFLGYEMLQENGSVAVSVAMRERPDVGGHMVISALLTPIEDGTFQLTSTSLQRPMASGVLPSKPLQLRLPYAALPVGTRADGSRNASLHCHEGEFVVFQAKLHPKGLFGAGMTGTLSESLGVLSVAPRRLAICYLIQPHPLADRVLRAMNRDMLRKVVQFQESLTLGDRLLPVYPAGDIPIWENLWGVRHRDRDDAKVLDCSLADMLGLTAALAKLSPACRLEEETTFWLHWDELSYLLSREPRPAGQVSSGSPSAAQKAVAAKCLDPAAFWAPYGR